MYQNIIGYCYGFSTNIYGLHLTSDSQTNSSHKRLEQLEKLSKSIDPNSAARHAVGGV